MIRKVFLLTSLICAQEQEVPEGWNKEDLNLVFSDEMGQVEIEEQEEATQTLKNEEERKAKIEKRNKVSGRCNRIRTLKKIDQRKSQAIAKSV